jgi:hypothetical protein
VADRRPLRHRQIDAVLSQLRRAWLANPDRRLVEVVSQATRGSGAFTPDDVNDAEIFDGLSKLRRGK